MLPYVVRRVLTALPTIAIFACFVFLLQKLLPGDPVLAMAGEDRDPATLAALRIQYHLDDPLPLQFLRWAGDALQGNLGESLRNHDSVLHLIAQKLPVTLELAVLSTLFSVLIGVPAAAADRRHGERVVAGPESHPSGGQVTAGVREPGRLVRRPEHRVPR